MDEVEMIQLQQSVNTYII